MSSVASSFSSSCYHRDGSLPSPTPTTPPAASTPVESQKPLLSPLLSVLRLFDRRLQGRDDPEVEVCEFPITREEYRLLWWLLGEEGPSPAALATYLPALQANGLPSSAQALQRLGRRVNNSVRYDFFSQVDAVGNISTTLLIRMPTVLHDQTVTEAGQLLREVITPTISQDVTSCSLKCEFSDKFQRMLSAQRVARRPKTAEKPRPPQPPTAVSGHRPDRVLRSAASPAPAHTDIETPAQQPVPLPTAQHPPTPPTAVSGNKPDRVLRSAASPVPANEDVEVQEESES